MLWYDYLICFVAALFIANFFPHFVRGICGQSFPTPFADPPGKGLSSPTINVFWSLANLLVGGGLLKIGSMDFSFTPALLTVFAGFAVMSIMHSIIFGQRLNNQD